MDSRIRTYRHLARAASLLLLLICFHPGHGQQYKVVEYGKESGLPQPYIYTLVQDHTGRLWVGTGKGLARFDGYAFESFTTSDSLSDNFIVVSHANEQGVWFGHMNGGLSLYDGYEFHKVLDGDQGTGSITDMKTLGTTTWVSTQSGGIWRIGSQLEAVRYQDRAQTLFVFAFELLSSSECLVGSMDGIYRYSLDPESDEMSLIGYLEGLPETKIQDMVLSSDNEILYILTLDEGIYMCDTKDLSLTPKALELDSRVEMEGPQQIFEDSERNIWITTFGSGVYKLFRDESGAFTSIINYTEQNGLPGNNVKYIMEDREQNIWMGMYGEGLARLLDEAYTFYPLDNPGMDNSCYSIYIEPQYAWFGTGTGVVRLDRQDGELLQLSGPEFGLHTDLITSVAGSGEGDIWVGTRGRGIFRWEADRKRYSPVFISRGNLENYVNAMQLYGEHLWIATERGVCKLNTSNGELDWFNIRRGIPHNTVKNLWIDSTGRVWLSTLSNSLSFIQGDSVGKKAIPGLDSPLNINSIWMDREGTTWIGTNGSGVWRFDGDSLVNLGTEDGLLSDYCLSVAGDESGHIWISHRTGLSRIRMQDNQIKTFGENIGIEQMEFNLNAFFKEPSGRMWFGSSGGILAYDPAMQRKEAPAPTLSLISTQVNGEEVDLRNELRLPSGRHDLRLEYIGVNLKNPEAVTYTYQMEGLGDNWSQPTSDSYVLFNKLAYGDYTFRLRAMNAEGVFSEDPLSYSIHIAKPFWKRWWFFILAFFASLALLYAYIQRREYKFRMEKLKLEKAVQARTEEVVKQKLEIEKQNDAIRDQNEEIRKINTNMTDSITYARRIQSAVFPLEEQLSGLFQDSFIFNRPKDIVSGDFFWVTQQKGKKVVTVADCTGHGVPGAFMSMLGITLLNDLVNTRQVLKPDTILNMLKNEIIRSLRQKGKSDEATDGMDMALCVYDPEQSILQYAGGFNPLVLIREGEYSMIKADPMPIGIGAITGREFTCQSMEIRKGDVIYLYSDGFEDQFGGERNKKFSRKRFRELLLEIHRLTMPEQKRTLENALENWMDGQEQVDDIIVLGIRF